MTKLPTDMDHSDSGAAHGDVTGVFKSGDMPLQRLNSGTNSAVSDVAVDRAAEDLDTAKSLVDFDTGMTPITRAPVEEEAPDPKVKVTDTLESLEASVAKVDALVQSVEQRQSQIEDAHQKAEAMLAEVNRIAEAMTFSDSLRDRINATVARTRRLRGENGK